MRNLTLNALSLAHRDHIKAGTHVTYLTMDMKQIDYAMRMMLDLYRHVSFSRPTSVIHFETARMHFIPTSSRVDRLYGHRNVIIADHVAFKKLNIHQRVEWKETMQRLNTRNGYND